MAGIQTSVSVRDGMSAQFATMTRSINVCLGAFMDMQEATGQSVNASAFNEAREAMQTMNAAAEDVVDSIRRSEEQQERLNQSARSGQSAFGELASKVKGLVAAYASWHAIGSVVNMSDELTNATARINMMNDGMQTTDEVMKRIYGAAQSARGSYMDMAAMVAKLGNNARSAFSSTNEIVDFAELIQKQFTIAGASTQEASNAMLQLTQAMGSGVLRGDELNSIFEQAPNIIQSVADYMNVPVGKIRDMASEGQITSEIVKNAVFAASDDITSKMASMPTTWSQVWQGIQNQALETFQPILNMIGQITGREEFQTVVSEISSGFQTIAAIATPVISEIIDGTIGLGTTISENWSIIAPIIMGITTALLIYHGAILALNIAEGIHNAIQDASTFKATVHSATLAMQAGATFAATREQYGLNAALLACPITWIILAIIAVIAVIYAVVAAINKVQGTTISATGIIFGVITTVAAAIANVALGITNFIIGIIVSLRNIIANFAAAFSIIFNHPVQAIEALFLSLFNFIVGIVESAAKMIDTLLDTDLASAVAGFKGKVQTKIDTIVEGAGGEKAKTINAADYQIKGIDYGKAWDKGYSAGQKVDNKVSDVIGSFGDIKNLVSDGGAAVGAGSEAASSLGAGNEAASGLGAGSDGLGDIAKNTGNAAAAGNTTAANTGKIADSMENAEENLEWIKDIAEREIIDRTVFSKVEVNMGGIANNVNNMTDLDAIPAYINTALQQQLAIGAEG